MEQNIGKYTIKMFILLDSPPANANHYSVKSKPHILILDRYGFYSTWQFFDFCWKRNIHPICLPANSAHILQSLDIELFCHLFRCYSNQLVISVRVGGNVIRMEQFSK